MGRGLVAASGRAGRRFSQRSGQESRRAGSRHNVHLSRAASRPWPAATQSGQPYYLTYGDYFAIRDQSRFLRAVSPVLEREDIRAVSDYGSTNGQVFGVAPEYNQIRNTPIEPGRWFNDEDNSQHRRVAVVGWELLKNMFPGEPAVGSTILLNDVDFKVIGVIPKIGKRRRERHQPRASSCPSRPCAMLFPLKAQNSGKCHLVYQLPAHQERPCTSKRRMKFTQIIARRHGFDPRNSTTRFRIGTPSTALSAWPRFLTPWIGSSAWSESLLSGSARSASSTSCWFQSPNAPRKLACARLWAQPTATS
jgi:hypothetical protein